MNPKPFTGDLFAVPLETFWTATVHGKENSSSNQKHLDKNRVHFGGQNKAVFDFLMSGGEVDGDVVRDWNPRIMHLPRRIKDLTDINSRLKMGFSISSKWQKCKNLKVYWMDAEQIEYNRKIYEAKLQSPTPKSNT